MIGFGEQATKFDPMVQLGSIVQISKASLKPKKNNVRTSCPPPCSGLEGCRPVSLIVFSP